MTRPAIGVGSGVERSTGTVSIIGVGSKASTPKMGVGSVVDIKIVVGSADIKDAMVGFPARDLGDADSYGIDVGSTVVISVVVGSTVVSSAGTSNVGSVVSSGTIIVDEGSTVVIVDIAGSLVEISDSCCIEGDGVGQNIIVILTVGSGVGP